MLALRLNTACTLEQSLEQSLRLETLKQNLNQESGWGESCFPRSEEFINENAEALLSARRWATKIEGFIFRSPVDQFFVQIFPFFKKGCLSHYRGKGRSLENTFSPAFLKYYDRMLLMQLKKYIAE